MNRVRQAVSPAEGVPFPLELVPLGPPDEAISQDAWPLYAHAVRAGFPSPADDYTEGRISLDKQLIRNKEATFFLRVEGDSMQGLGILHGDLLVVDRSIDAAHTDIVIAVVDGELTVKQLTRTPQGCVLRAANPAYPDIVIGADQELTVWGVVRWAIHKVYPCPRQ